MCWGTRYWRTSGSGTARQDRCVALVSLTGPRARNHDLDQKKQTLLMRMSALLQSLSYICPRASIAQKVHTEINVNDSVADAVGLSRTNLRAACAVTDTNTYIYIYIYIYVYIHMYGAYT